MLRRSVLRLSAGNYVKRVPIETTTQVPSYLLSRREFSVSPKQNGPHRPGSTSKPPETGSILPKFIVGSVALGAAFMAAYQTGYLDKYLVTEQQAPPELATSGTAFQDPKELSETLEKPIAESEFLESDVSTGNMKHVDESTESHPDLSELERSSNTESESQFQAKDSSEITAREANHTEVKDLPPSSHQSSVVSDETGLASTQSPNDSPDTKSPEVTPDAVQHEAIEITPTLKQADTVQRENEAHTLPTEHVTSRTKIEDVSHNDEKPSSLLDEYHLIDEGGATTTTSSDRHQVIEHLGDAYISKDGKLVLDFLDAIHEAERRQAEIDARTFSEHKRNIKEKYEKELKDARVRELMYAEREALLDKELKRERAKAIAAVKSLQENLEEKHRMELDEKENEAELNLKKAQELAKAELAAAIASEKASQIEKMAEANININALCMAFYARSEEARQSHSVHKLALGALALEDAVSRGLPIHKEIEVIHTSLEGIDNDSLLELALSSLPEETRKYGSDTMLQLNRKFDALKGTLRHYSLIPPGGGGILTHSLARVASWLKVREADQSGDGIESLINKVESFLAQGKLSEAADALEKGVNGTQAAAAVDDWVKRARNRAITEQALTLLQSYATTVNLT